MSEQQTTQHETAGPGESEDASSLDIFVARQPIFDSNLHVFGYELLFRDSKDVEKANISSGEEAADAATSKVLLNTIMELDLERLVDDPELECLIVRPGCIDRADGELACLHVDRRSKAHGAGPRE